MTASEITDLKKRIREKFTTLARFAMIAKIEYSDMNRELTAIVWRVKNDKKLHATQVAFLNRISKKCDKLDSEVSTAKDLSLADLIKIKGKIDEAGGVLRFCKANPEFKVSSVYALLDGDRTLRGKTAMALMKKLKLA